MRYFTVYRSYSQGECESFQRVFLDRYPETEVRVSYDDTLHRGGYQVVIGGETLERVREQCELVVGGIYPARLRKRAEGTVRRSLQ